MLRPDDGAAQSRVVDHGLFIRLARCVFFAELDGANFRWARRDEQPVTASGRSWTMGKVAAFALVLGIASAIVVSVVAQWQVDSSQARSPSRIAGILIAEEAGQEDMPTAPAPAPRVSLLWPAITGGAVAVVVLGVGIAFDVTGRK